MRATRLVAVVVGGCSTVAVAGCGIAAVLHHPVVPRTALAFGAAIGIGLTVVATNRDERAAMLERQDETTDTIQRLERVVRELRVDLQKALNEAYNDGYDQGREGRAASKRSAADASMTPVTQRPSS